MSASSAALVVGSEKRSFSQLFQSLESGLETERWKFRIVNFVMLITGAHQRVTSIEPFVFAIIAATRCRYRVQ